MLIPHCLDSWLTDVVCSITNCQKKNKQTNKQTNRQQKSVQWGIEVPYKGVFLLN
jgi:hypothetical protein